MMRRKIVSIDEKKCNGCGLCIEGCHEGAIELIDGKAKLVSDEYCDGLGDCLPQCPTGAIEIIERESKEYDEEAVKKRMADKANEKSSSKPMPCGCPGTMAKKIERKTLNVANNNVVKAKEISLDIPMQSQLSQWPVQLKLVNPNAQYFKNANLLVAADCTAYAYANFHNDFIKDHITVIGCPKLDDNEYYKEKLTEILKVNNIKSITVVRMEVPCCGGIINSIKEAMLKSQTIVPYREVTISSDGNIL